MYMKMLSAECCPFCLGLNESTCIIYICVIVMDIISLDDGYQQSAKSLFISFFFSTKISPQEKYSWESFSAVFFFHSRKCSEIFICSKITILVRVEMSLDVHVGGYIFCLFLDVKFEV